jgi:CheY-like chemotaxis protein/anti-sigma regulatory factor (Ser/Thr protein kinase)
VKQIILIIDDDEKIRKVLSEIVEKLGLLPLTAKNGVEALHLLKYEKIDLIITDLVMPEMDGLKFIVEARSLTPGIPIAVISGYGDVKNATFALTHGAFNFITKPFTIDDVENVIRKGLRLRELSLGTERLLDNIRNHTEISIPSYLHLIPSVAHYIIKECQWRGVESENLLNNISVCADEMLTNALIHGNESNPEKQITVKLHFDPEAFTVTVKDEGKGFEVESFLHQLRDDELDIPAKRGLFIVNYLMDKISFNEKGNEITATMNFNKKVAQPPLLNSEN